MDKIAKELVKIAKDLIAGDKENAIKLLNKYSQSLIKKVYDNKDVQEAILTLNPKFEYPDWDNETIGKFLKKFGK